ncbi:GBP1-like protein [Mya arenaria]|uniref:GBP1-like protein n=1 Tax=Mya arenaria TaxID=6604 RepID=A0ABY7EVG3_MYAAR|nr:GBP1-like protein [Mya arenaria]
MTDFRQAINQYMYSKESVKSSCTEKFGYRPSVPNQLHLIRLYSLQLTHTSILQLTQHPLLPVMASNGNPTDSSGVDLKMTLKSFEHTSKVEPTQANKQSDSILAYEKTRPVMASNENHTDLSASMDLKMTEIRRKNNPNKPPPMKRPVPQCLVRARGENLLEVCEDVLDEISRIDTPCVIVAIAGPYRTGKSYLMNRLADAQTGFAIGDTIQSTTKGIWVWCRDHPEQKDTVLILLDTEGIGDVEKGDSNHDNRIFTLATLLSSVLVYNMKGAFDQEATVAAMIVSYIYSQKPKQLQVSKPVNGPMFATLTRKYVDALARGAVPDVDDAFASAAKIENERVKDECMDMFRLRIEDVDLPLPSSSLDKHFTEARCSALEYMSTNVVQDVASLIEKHALMEMDLFRQQFQRQNEEEIEKHCTNVLLGLASFSNLQAGLQNKGYEVIGGHRKFKQDVDMVRQEYEQALRNYEQREIGLVWKSFAKQLGPKETKILDKDDELSKEEKKREKEENEISMKRMKIELDKANQNALHKQMKELDEQQKKLNTELRRRDKEHEDKVTALQDKIASLESNKEVQKKMLDQITSLLEEDKREKKKANKKLEEKHRREREKREELEQKERERKGGFVINRVLNALWNN